MKRIFVFVCLLASVNGTLLADLKINEFMASNIHSQLNPDYSDFVDWIEIYNEGDVPVNLGDVYITDDFSDPQKWRLPGHANIEARGFYTVWADGESRDEHASFKLSESGEEIGLFAPDGTVIDTMSFGSQSDNVSFGRFPDGGNLWCYYSDPTQNAPNTGGGVPSGNRTTRPVFSVAGGLYSNAQSLTLTAEPGALIYYTLDGSIPNPTSIFYDRQIDLNRSTVVRAMAAQDGRLPSKTVTHTYVIEEPSTLPVICLTTEPDFLFDETIGITVGIPVSDELGAPPPFDPDANFWHRWERPVYIEYFETGGNPGLAQEAGIKIFGGFFGRQIRQKAFTLFARNKYNDADFDYPLFPDKNIQSFKRFLLRASSNDFNRTFIRDAMMNTLVIGQMDVDWQAYQPAVVYINGQFWGLYNIREKTNEFYPESNYGVDTDDIDLIEGVRTAAHGDSEEFIDLLDFVSSNLMDQSENYETVRAQMDVIEFMNYFITQIYVGNMDWLIQNIKCWRDRSTNVKWRWILYDMDWGFAGEIMNGEEQYQNNTLQWALNQGEASTLFYNLMRNEQFRLEFSQRFATHLNFTFRPERVLEIIGQMVEKIDPEMDRQMERWGAIPNRDYWQDQLTVLTEFARRRPAYLFQYLGEYVEINTQLLQISVSDTAAGSVTVFDTPISKNRVTGHWFEGVPIQLNASANPGWRFMGWEGDFEGDSVAISIFLKEHSRLKAVFERDDVPQVVISEIHYNPSKDLQGDDDLYEFVEVTNKGSQSVDVTGYYFSSGITFSFPDQSWIAKDEAVVIAKTPAIYENRGYQVFAWEGGRLANEGETLCLRNAAGLVIDSVKYDDHFPWPELADGGGPSIELIDFAGDNNAAAAWTVSEQTGGTPGRGIGTGVKTDNSSVASFGLYPNYPNPFNAETTITFNLNRPSKTHVDIISLKGERIADLIDRNLEFGHHRLTWNAAEQPTGVYLIRLRSGRYESIRKCLLIK